MATVSKVYVIDPAAVKPQDVLAGKRGTERTDYSPDREGQQKPRDRRRRSSGPVEEQGSPLAAFLAYLAGPFAILATRRGRESRLWIALAILSAALACLFLARPGDLLAAPRGTGFAFLIGLSLACLASFMGFAAWAHAVILLGRHRGHLLQKLPSCLRHPGAVGFLGLLIPGFGLHASGHPKRAAAVIASILVSFISIIVLLQAPNLWRLGKVGLLAGRGDLIEWIFIAAGAAAAFGALVWIVQALDGMRLAGNRGGERAGARGDLAALALLLAIAAFAATFKPARVAETIDRFGVAIISDGYRVIPLAAAETAMRLDPSRPEYAMQAIQLNEALGRADRAEALRHYLEDRWQPYERMLRLEAAAVGPAIEPTDFDPVEHAD